MGRSLAKQLQCCLHRRTRLRQYGVFLFIWFSEVQSHSCIGQGVNLGNTDHKPIVRYLLRDLATFFIDLGRPQLGRAGADNSLPLSRVDCGEIYYLLRYGFCTF